MNDANGIERDPGRQQAERAGGAAGQYRRRLAAAPRFDEDDEYDANGWERVPTWRRKPRS